MDWVRNFLGFGTERNNYKKRMNVCCPNCLKKFELEFEYNFEVVINPILNQEQINKIEKIERNNNSFNANTYFNTNNHNLNNVCQRTNEKTTSEKIYKDKLDEIDLKCYSSIKEYENTKKTYKSNMEHYSIETTGFENLNSTTNHTNTNANDYLKPISLTKHISIKKKDLITSSNSSSSSSNNKIRYYDSNNTLSMDELDEYKKILIMDIIDYKKLIELKKKIIPDGQILNYVIRNFDNIEILEKIVDLDFPCDSQTFLIGVKTGNKEIVEWLMKNNCLIDKSYETGEIYESAFSYGLDYLKFIKSIGIKCPKDFIEFAIQKKSYDTIEWLIVNGNQFTSRCFSIGAGLNDIAILEYLKSNGCEWGILDEYDKNEIKTNPNISNWLKENGCEWNI